MACHGSANLELSIPGFVEPVRDEMAGAKGVGTNVHAALESFIDRTDFELLCIQQLVDAYALLHWTKRREIVADRAKLDDWVWSVMQVSPGTHNMLMRFIESLAHMQLPPAMLKFIAQTATYIGGMVTRLAGVPMYGELSMEAEWLPSKPRTTADVVFGNKRVLEIVDYKTGKIPVHAADNDQMLFYAACAYLRTGCECGEITVHILQPGNQDSWTFTVQYLQDWMNRAINADRAIIAKDLTRRPSDHCTYCPANPHTRGDKGNKFCPEMMDVLYPPQFDELEMLDM